MSKCIIFFLNTASSQLQIADDFNIIIYTKGWKRDEQYFLVKIEHPIQRNSNIDKESENYINTCIRSNSNLPR